MREMIYTTKDERKILDKGKCDNRPYFILSLGQYPTAYIGLTEKEANRFYLYKLINNISVHGGFTYGEYFLNISNNSKDTTNVVVIPTKTILQAKIEDIEGLGLNINLDDYYFIGWDYCHAGDYNANFKWFSFSKELKKWTTSEIKEEVRSVNKQLDELLKGDDENE